jgi:ubiquinone/menaquinone biosynthesis C-methylase UbiE
MPTEKIPPQTLAEQYKTPANLETRISLHERFSTNRDGRGWFFEQLEIPAEAAILELGCGPALGWKLNADRVSPGWRVTLTDFSAGMAAAARQNTAGLNGRFTNAVADAADSPFAGQSFDAVMANHMLYHLSDASARSRALAGIRRVLKPGGRFYAATNGIGHMRELVELVNQFDPSLGFMRSIVQNFSLESGPAQAAQYLGEVSVRRYPDALIVDDAQALIDYILSSTTTFTLPAERKAALGDFVRHWMAAHGGVMHIQKDMGLISATRMA